MAQVWPHAWGEDLYQDGDDCPGPTATYMLLRRECAKCQSVVLRRRPRQVYVGPMARFDCPVCGALVDYVLPGRRHAVVRVGSIVSRTVVTRNHADGRVTVGVLSESALLSPHALYWRELTYCPRPLGVVGRASGVMVAVDIAVTGEVVYGGSIRRNGPVDAAFMPVPGIDATVTVPTNLSLDLGPLVFCDLNTVVPIILNNPVREAHTAMLAAAVVFARDHQAVPSVRLHEQSAPGVPHNRTALVMGSALLAPCNVPDIYTVINCDAPTNRHERGRAERKLTRVLPKALRRLPPDVGYTLCYNQETVRARLVLTRPCVDEFMARLLPRDKHLQSVYVNRRRTMLDIVACASGDKEGDTILQLSPQGWLQATPQSLVPDFESQETEVDPGVLGAACIASRFEALVCASAAAPPSCAPASEPRPPASCPLGVACHLQLIGVSAV